jgi:hypothetical protein
VLSQIGIAQQTFAMLFCRQSSILLTRPSFVPTAHRFIELRFTDLAALHHHSSLKITSIYTHFEHEKKRALAEQLLSCTQNGSLYSTVN